MTASTYTTFFMAGSSSEMRWRRSSSAVSFLSGSFLSGGGGAAYTPSQELNGSQSRGAVFQHSGWQSNRS